MDAAFQPQIILLREGTDTSQGKGQIISNINACQAVAESVKTTLGPRGMDKLVCDGQTTTISNDGVEGELDNGIIAVVPLENMPGENII